MNIYTEAEKKLAELLGWQYISIFYGDFFDTFMRGESTDMRENGLSSKCTGIVPHYCRDNAEAFKLMCEYQLDIGQTGCVYVSYEINTVEDGYKTGIIKEFFNCHPDKETATRYAIVLAVIGKLEGAASCKS